jgi:hypothetical protein
MIEGPGGFGVAMSTLDKAVAKSTPAVNRIFLFMVSGIRFRISSLFDKDIYSDED